MPEDSKWDLSNIIGEADQAEIEKIADIGPEEPHSRLGWLERFLCRSNIHRRSRWRGVSMVTLVACNEASGKQVPYDYTMSMRVCLRCGSPQVKVKEVS